MCAMLQQRAIDAPSLAADARRRVAAKRAAVACAVFLGAFSASTARAHQFWLLPQAFQIAPGTVGRVAAWEGQGFSGTVLSRDPARIARFELVGPTGTTPVVGRSGACTEFFRAPADGWYELVYEGRPTPHVLPAAQFDEYLEREGLTGVRAYRAALGEADQPGRERFTRYAKALVRVGQPPASGGDHALGLPLELVAEQDPTTLHAGDALRVRVLLRGQPLPGARVWAYRQQAGQHVLIATTDQAGNAGVPVEPGTWLLATLYVERAAPGGDADWESHWSSLVMQVGKAP